MASITIRRKLRAFGYGMGSMLVLFPTPARPVRELSPHRPSSVSNALRADWDMIGSDMDHAIDHEASGSSNGKPEEA